MLHKAKNLIVADEEAFSEITRIYKYAKDLEKQIEAQRKAANAPEQSRINERNDKAKKLVEPLKQIQDLCKKRLTDYQLMLEKQKEEQQQRLLADSSQEELPVELPIPTLRGSGAIVYYEYERCFEVEELHKVPNEYWIVDEEKIRRHVALGYESIPGVKIFTKKITKVRSR